ncbi:MAG TPA: hypothetical protein VK053_14620 [Jiangellaceae bacterium]|nr:hypothetical protein [Jiangellaceae bacterium]
MSAHAVKKAGRAPSGPASARNVPVSTIHPKPIIAPNASAMTSPRRKIRVNSLLCVIWASTDLLG